jgi:plasmid stability protein
MANLIIRNLPDEVHERLKLQAKRNRRSLNQEVIAALEERYTEPEASLDGMISESKARYAPVRQSLTADEVRRAMKAGRDRMAKANGLVEEMRSKMKGFMTTKEISKAIEEGRR